MCGENPNKLPWINPNAGSPPHVRGKRHTQASCHRLFGITPACAGKTNKFTACSGV